MITRFTSSQMYVHFVAVARSGFVSLDCADPVALAEFWAAMLGGEIMFSSNETVDVRTEGVWLSATKVAGRPASCFSAILVEQHQSGTRSVASVAGSELLSMRNARRPCVAGAISDRLYSDPLGPKQCRSRRNSGGRCDDRVLKSTEFTFSC
jgi:hypothetical protein